MTNTPYRVYKETAVPGTWVSNAVYFITATNANYIEIYVTSSTGVPRRVPTTTDIAAMIAAMIASAISTSNGLVIVDTITARNALLPLTAITNVYVKDATGDSTVAAGGAFYLYDPGTSSWIKTSEAESLDVQLTWASISGKPSSSAAAIDLAVGVAHSHSNKTQLDKVGESSGLLTYNGSLPSTGYESVNW